MRWPKRRPPAPDDERRQTNFQVAAPPRLAPAAEKPCQLYTYHAPIVVVTEGHHRHPVYLQNRVYGHIQDPELLWVCSNCHEAIHAWIYYLMGERREPNPHPPARAKAEARLVLDWYLAAGGTL